MSKKQTKAVGCDGPALGAERMREDFGAARAFLKAADCLNMTPGSLVYDPEDERFHGFANRTEDPLEPSMEYEEVRGEFTLHNAGPATIGSVTYEIYGYRGDESGKEEYIGSGCLHINEAAKAKANGNFPEDVLADSGWYLGYDAGQTDAHAGRSRMTNPPRIRFETKPEFRFLERWWTGYAEGYREQTEGREAPEEGIRFPIDLTDESLGRLYEVLEDSI